MVEAAALDLLIPDSRFPIPDTRIEQTLVELSK
ncbi:Hypothetical Protein XCAW_04351 [Xanthomonas citri subsp. citri Aw12879]|nr:Hypothetical Protein XCAW_04351 [Xanthomonas citri subsp. citri Aw12879]